MAILAPLLGAIGIQLTGRWPNLRETVTLIAAGAAFVFVQSLVSLVFGGARPELVLIADVLPGVDLAFQGGSP